MTRCNQFHNADRRDLFGGEVLLFTIAEACAIARIGRSTLYGAIRRRELRPMKIGRRTLIPARELYGWLGSPPPIRARAQAPAPQVRSSLRAKVQAPETL